MKTKWDDEAATAQPKLVIFWCLLSTYERRRKGIEKVPNWRASDRLMDFEEDIARGNVVMVVGIYANPDDDTETSSESVARMKSCSDHIKAKVATIDFAHNASEDNILREVMPMLGILPVLSSRLTPTWR